MFIITPIAISNVLQWLFVTIYSSDYKFFMVLLSFPAIPLIWLVNNIIFGFLSLLAVTTKLSSKTQIYIGLFSLVFAGNAIFNAIILTEMPIFSVLNLASLFTAGMVIHATVIFIKQRKIKNKN